MLWVARGLAVLLAAAMCAIAWQQIKIGVVKQRNFVVRRQQKPLLFWATQAFELATTAYILYGAFFLISE